VTYVPAVEQVSPPSVGTVGSAGVGVQGPTCLTCAGSPAGAPGFDCPCPPGSGGCPGPCTRPQIFYHPERCLPELKCEDIPYEVTPALPGNCIEIPFYGKPVTFKATTKVPVIVVECEEIIEFKDITIRFKCCDVKVCIPCRKCWKKTERCVETDVEVNLEALRRRDQTIDVYALNVPGLPKRFVLRPQMTEAQYKGEFPNKPIPTYP
jgi:hypothetical protein